MAIMHTDSVEILGIVCAVPKKSEDNSIYGSEFGQSDVDKIIQMTGIETRRVAEDNICTSDLCVAAAEDLIERLQWDRQTIDLLVFVSQTADYLLPSTACSIHGRMGLSRGCAAFDMTLGCTGYIYGLSVVASFIANSGASRALLLVGDTISKVVSPKDRSTLLLFGDAGSATALIRNDTSPGISFILESDGKGQNHLIVPAGGFRKRRSMETSKRSLREDGGCRSEEDLYMNGAELLAFTLSSVPAFIHKTLKSTDKQPSDIDHYVFHQANRFMLEHFIRKAGIPAERVPINLDRYGNTSSASIPLAIASELHESVKSGKRTLLNVGFGVGYSLAGSIFEFGPTEHTAVIEV